jgi:subtilisin family serine protease
MSMIATIDHRPFQAQPGLRLLAAALLAGFLSIHALQVGPPSDPQSLPALHRADRLLIEPNPAADPVALDALHRSLGARIRNQLGDHGEAQVLEVPTTSDIPTLIDRYLDSGLILRAEPDYILRVNRTPNDPGFGNQWSLRNIGQTGGVPGADIDAVRAWDTLTSAENVIVAIIDSGIRYTHEDLAANMWVNPGEIPGNGIDDDGNGFIDDVHGINAIDNTGDPMDPSGHGTHVAGIIGAVGNNNRGISGVAWRVQLMALRFIDHTESGATSDAIQCIDYARIHGAHIINASWGGASRSSFMESAIRRARDAGIIFVTGAGNDTIDMDESPVYPGSYNLENIVVVTGTTDSDQLAWYSNYGANSVHLAAPGSQIYSTYGPTDTDYSHQTGTSMSAPLVAGAFALLRARYPDETYRQLIDRLLAAVDPLPSLQGKTITGGRLNLHRALGPSLQAAFSASPVAGEPPLTVQFTDQTLGTVTSRTWDFGDGSPLSSATNPVHTYEHPGFYTVTLSVGDANRQTSLATESIAVVPNYRIEPASYQWIDPSAMPTLSLSDDGVSPPQSLPFTFRFYGRDHTQVHVGANGIAGFVNQGLDNPHNTDLPNPDAPNAILCPYWDDLNPAAGGTIHIGTIGNIPDRRVVFSWVGVRHKSVPPTELTFQVVLHESSNEILFQYQQVRPDRSQGAGRRATIGIEDHSGHVAARYSYMGSTLLANSQAIRFVPDQPAPPPKRLVVRPPDVLFIDGFTGGPFQPDSLVWTLENAGPGPLPWSGTLTPDWAQLSPITGTIDPGQEVSVALTLNAHALDLGPGTYPGTLLFTDTESGIDEPGGAPALRVHPSPAIDIEPALSSTQNVIHLRLDGPPGWTCTLETSIDLNNWTVLQTRDTDELGRVEFTELELGSDPTRYYRARFNP